jgi:hypothetical protein
VLAYRLEDRPFDEVAEFLGVPVATARTWNHRGEARLRELLGAPLARRSAPLKATPATARSSRAARPSGPIHSTGRARHIERSTYVNAGLTCPRHRTQRVAQSTSIGPNSRVGALPDLDKDRRALDECKEVWYTFLSFECSVRPASSA